MQIEARCFFQNALYFEKKNNLQKARAMYILCLRQEKRAVTAWLNLGVLYSNQKKSQKAIYCYKRAIALKPGIKSIYNISLEYFLNKHYYSSIFYLQWAIRMEKKFTKGYILLAYCYGTINKHYHAYACLKNVLNLNSTNFIALYTLTLLLFYKKDEAYKKYFTKLQTHYPHNKMDDNLIGNTFQAVKNHKKIDALKLPGDSDLTAHVDFKELTRDISEIMVTKTTSQGILLERLGINDRSKKLISNTPDHQKNIHTTALRRLTHPSEMGSLFKAIALYPSKSFAPAGFDL